MIAIQKAGDARGMSLRRYCCFCGGGGGGGGGGGRYSCLSSQIDATAFNWDFTIYVNFSRERGQTNGCMIIHTLTGQYMFKNTCTSIFAIVYVSHDHHRPSCHPSVC